MKRLSVALLALIVAIAVVGCSGLVSANHAVPQILKVATSILPGGQVQASYSATLAASGGTQPYSWSVVAGSLPPGLALSATTGVIAGMPTASGQYSLTIQVTDPGSSPQTAKQAFTISIAAAGISPLQITTSSLSGGQVQASYSATLAASGGTPPYSWSVVGGSLPPGLALGASTGIIAGTPSVLGQYSFTIQVTDLGSSPQSARRTFAISIAAPGTSPLQITTSSLPNGQAQASYSATLSASGGTPPYSWSVVGGSLPPGLALGASTGIVAGTPSALGQYSFTIQVTDLGSSPQSARRTFAISIAAPGTSPLQITTSSLSGGQVQASYSATLSASGGTPPYSWSVTAGSLPPGLALDASTGMIAGTPTATGTFSFTVQVTDSSTPTAQTATASLSATVFTSAAGGVFCGAINFGVSLPNCDPDSPASNTVFDTTMPNTSAYTTVTVSAGGDLQTAINNASCSPNGTIITLNAGSTYNSGFGSPVYGAGPYQLPNKTCAVGQWIIIESSALASLPASGTRVDPTVSANMPKIQSIGGVPAMVTNIGANHYRFVGIEFNAPAATDVVSLIDLDPSNNTSPQVFTHTAPFIVFDRCYIHGNADPGLTHDYRRGISIGDGPFAAIDSYINQFHSSSLDTGADTQAIWLGNGNGPIKIVNNYLSSSGENVMAGGTERGSNGPIPSDIEFRHNHVFKPPAWKSNTNLVVKNIFELKNAQRILLDGNVFEYSWLSAQAGFCMVFTPVQTSDGPNTVVNDLTVTHNIIRHCANGMQVVGGNLPGGKGTQRAIFQNNLYADISGANWGNGVAGTDGRFAQSGPNGGSAPNNLVFDHNTILLSGDLTYLIYEAGNTGFNIGPFQWTNNIASRNSLGITSEDQPEGTATLNAHANPLTWNQDVFINATSLANLYPTGTLWATPDSTAIKFTDNTNCVGGTFTASACLLLSTSPYHNAGTDGKDIGADIDSINSATAGVIQAHD